ncbi:hypothetical protein AX774_g6025 [Zancudomyces culisetae]|uniref:Uncharacterized protein n=1 Tax=Zancudomyces culisetae TaxID=1213189 RepID=A0A1R1PHT0_ZANCU|nr:hypothetical protein AX774_g6025 [Zancudomyces culisetae]|eukprot:OMH80531.1 hypothetical protein AX774_g6025 [Zancudomyces culisetae]
MGLFAAVATTQGVYIYDQRQSKLPVLSWKHRFSPTERPVYMETFKTDKLEYLVLGARGSETRIKLYGYGCGGMAGLGGVGGTGALPIVSSYLIKTLDGFHEHEIMGRRYLEDVSGLQLGYDGVTGTAACDGYPLLPTLDGLSISQNSLNKNEIDLFQVSSDGMVFTEKLSIESAKCNRENNGNDSDESNTPSISDLPIPEQQELLLHTQQVHANSQGDLLDGNNHVFISREEYKDYHLQYNNMFANQEWPYVRKNTFRPFFLYHYKCVDENMLQYSQQETEEYNYLYGIVNADSIDYHNHDSESTFKSNLALRTQLVHIIKMAFEYALYNFGSIENLNINQFSRLNHKTPNWRAFMADNHFNKYASEIVDISLDYINRNYKLDTNTHQFLNITNNNGVKSAGTDPSTNDTPRSAQGRGRKKKPIDNSGIIDLNLLETFDSPKSILLTSFVELQLFECMYSASLADNINNINGNTFKLEVVPVETLTNLNRGYSGNVFGMASSSYKRYAEHSQHQQQQIDCKRVWDAILAPVIDALYQQDLVISNTNTNTNPNTKMNKPPNKDNKHYNSLLFYSAKQLLFNSVILKVQYLGSDADGNEGPQPSEAENTTSKKKQKASTLFSYNQNTTTTNNTRTTRGRGRSRLDTTRDIDRNDPGFTFMNKIDQDTFYGSKILSRTEAQHANSKRRPKTHVGTTGTMYNNYGHTQPIFAGSQANNFGGYNNIHTQNTQHSVAFDPSQQLGFDIFDSQNIMNNSNNNVNSNPTFGVHTSSLGKEFSFFDALNPSQMASQPLSQAPPDVSSNRFLDTASDEVPNPSPKKHGGRDSDPIPDSWHPPPTTLLILITILVFFSCMSVCMVM